MKRVIVLFFFSHCLCAPVKTFLGDADQEKNYVEIYSWEEIRLDCIDTTQRKKGKDHRQTRRNSCKIFSDEKIKGTKVSNRRVTDDKYGRTVGELSLKRENIQELF